MGLGSGSVKADTRPDSALATRQTEKPNVIISNIAQASTQTLAVVDAAVCGTRTRQSAWSDQCSKTADISNSTSACSSAKQGLRRGPARSNGQG